METRGYKDGRAAERGVEMEKQSERRMSDMKKWDGWKRGRGSNR